jgi:hypothetical protein
MRQSDKSPCIPLFQRGNLKLHGDYPFIDSPGWERVRVRAI